MPKVLPLIRQRSRSTTSKKNISGISISICGADETFATPEALSSARRIGLEIAQQHHTAVTLTTTGVSSAVAEAVMKDNGIVIGFSVANSEKEHSHTYKLPDAEYASIVYTGLSSDECIAMMLRSAQAVIVVCGRTGGLHQLTTQFGQGQVIGVLTSQAGASDEVAHIIKLATKGSQGIIFSSDPIELVHKVTAAILHPEMRAHRTISL